MTDYQTTERPIVTEADLEYMRGWCDHSDGLVCDLMRSASYVRGWGEREAAQREPANG